jgi:hypothetical protein
MRASFSRSSVANLQQIHEAFHCEPIGNEPEQFADNHRTDKVIAEAIADSLRNSGSRGEIGRIAQQLLE